MTSGRDPLLDSSDLPPLPWSSPADREPWPDRAADPREIVDAKGHPLFVRNWKEACAAIEYLVRAANRGADEPDPERTHEPGERHDYVLTCRVCGQKGTIRVSVDPDLAT